MRGAVPAWVLFSASLAVVAPAQAQTQSLTDGTWLAANDTALSMRPQAPPQVQTVAILILSGEESGIPLSQVYGDARKAIERHTALSVAPLDAIDLAVREAAVRECVEETGWRPGPGSCQSGAGKATGGSVS